MAKTLKNCRDAVRDILDELTAANWGDPRLNVVINRRYQKVYTAQCSVEKDYNVTASGIITGSIGKQEYLTSDGVPADIFKIRRVEVNFDNANTNSVNQRAFPLHTIDAVRDRLNNSQIGLLTYTHPNYYWIGGRLGFIPFFDKAGTFQVWYYPILPDLVNDSDTLTLFYPDRFYYAVVLGAAADALRFGQLESPDADKLDTQYAGEIVAMVEEMSDPLAEEGRSVVDVTGDSLDFAHGY